MKRLKFSTPNSSRLTLAALVALPLALSASACELIASVDRSLIPSGEGATGGSMSDAGDSSTAGANSGAGQPHGGGGTSASGGRAGESGGDAGASGADSAAGAAGEDIGGQGGASSGAGGVSGSGGVSSSAGAAGKGAAAGSGGVSASGGVSGSSGASGTGGVAGSGGGSSGVSGTSGESGGPSGSGGASGTSGASGSGGAGGSGPTGKVIYLTSTPKKSNFGGVSAADTLCNANPVVPGSYKALLVDGTTRVACTSAQCGTSGAAEGNNWVLAPNTKYVRADGTTVIGTTTSAAIFAFPLAASIDSTANSYWTGLNSDWTTSANTCTGWTEFSVVAASVGLGNESDSQAISGAIDNCGTLFGNVFACVQQ